MGRDSSVDDVLKVCEKQDQERSDSLQVHLYINDSGELCHIKAMGLTFMPPYQLVIGCRPAQDRHNLRAVLNCLSDRLC